MASGMEEMLQSPMAMVQYGLALAVPAVLAAIMNIGCGKKRDQPLRPGEKKTLSKPASSSKSKRASKSSSASAKSAKSAKKNKSGKSKKSVASKDKSGKSSKSAKRSAAKKSTSSKSSKSKKSKRELKSKKAAAVAPGAPASQRSDAAKQPSSASEKRAAKTAVALANDNSAKTAPTQVATASLKQPPSGGALDANANVAVATGAGGTTALVAIAGDSTREQLIKMEPAELRWSSSGGMQKISLINQSAERQAVKVKCSDNLVYRVNPVYAIVEPGQTLNVDVMRQNGSNKVDKIVFVTTRAGLEENAKNAFKPGAPASMMVLPLLATSAAAAHNQPALAV